MLNRLCATGFPLCGLSGLGSFTSLPLADAQGKFAEYLGSRAGDDGMSQLYSGGFEIAKGEQDSSAISQTAASSMVSSKAPTGFGWMATNAVNKAYGDGYFVRRKGQSSPSRAPEASSKAPSAIETANATFDLLGQTIRDAMAMKNQRPEPQQQQKKKISPWVLAGAGVVVVGALFLALRR